MSSRLKAFFLLAGVLAAAPARSVGLVSLTVGNLAGEGIRVEGVSLSLHLDSDQPPTLHFSADRVVLAEQEIAPLRIECPEFVWTRELIRCKDGSLHAAHPWLDRLGAAIDLSWRPLERRLQLTADGLRLAGGSLRLALDSTANAGQLVVNGSRLDLARLRGLGAGQGVALPEISGRGDLELSVGLEAGRVENARWRLQLSETALATEDGSILAEGVAGNSRGSWRRNGSGGDAELRLSMNAGELLTPFLYLTPGDRAVTLEADLSWDPVGDLLTLRRFAYRHPGLLSLDGNGSASSAPFTLRSLELRSGDTRAGPLYRGYFQPLLGTTVLESIAWQGGFRLSARQPPGGAMQVVVRFLDLGLEDAPDPQLHPDRHPRFALRGLSGKLHWSDRGEPSPSRLTWRDGHLLGSLEFGKATLEAQLQGRHFRLSKDVEIPLLDGSLWIDRLEIAAVPNGKPELDFDAVLTPVTLARLSSAFGWPALSGTLSGVLPGLALRQDGLRVDGQLLVRVFDGDVLIENLRLNGLFSGWPELSTDARATGLDLEQLTETFSFGKITGRLDGHVTGLKMENWQPVAFDAHFATPLDDEDAHSISQRAVDNISNLGGAGIGGSLSRTFLGIFEAFGYERIGIGCRLRDGVCRMSGVSPAEQGYHLVIGRGIPQINIKGFNTQADWHRLVRQLQQISAGGTPVVK